MIFTTLQSSRLVPFMSRARCKAYLLSTYLSRESAKFSTVDINTIHADLKKALEYLHSNKTYHGRVDAEHVLIEKVKLANIYRRKRIESRIC